MPDRTPLRHLVASLGLSLALAVLPAGGEAQAPDTLTFRPGGVHAALGARAGP